MCSFDTFFVCKNAAGYVACQISGHFKCVKIYTDLCVKTTHYNEYKQHGYYVSYATTTHLNVLLIL